VELGDRIIWLLALLLWSVLGYIKLPAAIGPSPAPKATQDGELRNYGNGFWAPRLVGIRADGALACIQTHNERLGDFLKRWQASLKEEGSRG